MHVAQRKALWEILKTIDKKNGTNNIPTDTKFVLLRVIFLPAEPEEEEL